MNSYIQKMVWGHFILNTHSHLTVGGFDMGNPGANIHLGVSGKSANIFAAADVDVAAAAVERFEQNRMFTFE